MELKGIDVSKYQGSIDWAKVKADGVQFAILRCGTGYNGGSKDSMFEQNYKNARNVGMPIGTYYYTYAQTVEQANADADNVIEWLKGKKFEYPVVYDVEENALFKLGKERVSNVIRTFCNKLEKAGYYVTVYANKNWLDNVIDSDCRTRYDIWLAQWASKPTYIGKYGMWQYSSKGSVKGITGNVDMDVAYKDYFSTIKSRGLNGYSKGNETTAHTIAGIEEGDLVSIKSGAKYYNGSPVPSWVLSQKWYVAEINGNRAVIDKNETGTNAINSPINVLYLSVAKATTVSAPTIKVGSTVKIKQGAKTYTGGNLASFVYGRKYKVKELIGDRAVVTYLGIVVAAVNVKDLTLV